MTHRHKPIYVEKHSFLRPYVDLQTLCETNVPFTFYITDADDTNSITSQWDVEKRLDDHVRPNFWGYFVRLFGVDEQGHSVSVYVDGYKPFIYTEAPSHWVEDDMLRAIENGLEHVATEANKKFSIRDVFRVTKTWRVNAFGFTNFEKITVFKIEFNSSFKRKTFIQLCEINRTWSNYEGLQHEFWNLDADLEPLEQFSNEYKIKWCHWVTIAPKCYTFRDSKVSRGNILLPYHERRTRAQIDIDCYAGSLTCDFVRSDLPKLLIMSYDIEVKGRPGIFPEPAEAIDPVITIGVSVERVGDPPGTYASQAVFCLFETENLRSEDVKLYYFETEAQLLEAYYHYWTDCIDPDLILGYNQYTFDGPYLYNRYKKLLQHMIPKEVIDNTASYYNRGLLDYGRIRNSRSVMESRETFSRAHGGSEKHTIAMPGRIELDLFVFAREEWHMIVGLNALAAIFLENAQKDDIHFSQITPMFLKGARERGELAKYCVRDTELPLMILRKKCIIIDQIEKSRLTGVTLNVMINRKQTIRVATLLKSAAYASQERYSFPEHPFRFVKDAHVLELFKGEHGKEGALVLQAEANFYPQPIATLDFAGLYPSIIRGYGLCYTTLILNPKYKEVAKYRKDIVRNKIVGAEPYEFCWAELPDGRKPLLYEILTSVLDARSRAKKELKKHAEGTFDWSVIQSRQLALKLIANSIYGFTVVDPTMNKYSCYPIGITVTHFGRQMIQTTKKEVETRVPGSKVIYGDTDSVMIKFSEDSSQKAFVEAFDTARMLAREISKLFPKECALEFEKVFCPYDLLGQKQYAGIKWTDANSEGTVKCAGLASVKSDTIGLVREWTDDILAILLVKRDHIAAKKYLIKKLIDFVRNPADPKDFAISIKLSKEIQEYAGENEIKQVASAIAKRDPGQTPRAGTKITFLHCIDKKNFNQHLPLDLEHYNNNKSRYAIDKLYYLHQLMIERIGSLFDLPSMAQDPYQWFLPFENYLKMQNNGGGIAKFLQGRQESVVSNSNIAVEPLTDIITTTQIENRGQSAEITMKNPGAAQSGVNECIDSLQNASIDYQIVDEGVENDQEVVEQLDIEWKLEKSLTQKMQSLSLLVDEFQEDSEFPMKLFKDTTNNGQSKFKKARLKKMEKKSLKEESRRLEIPLQKLVSATEKRKNGLPISQFCKVRKIDEK